MKGKGKGKDAIDSKECPLQFPDFTPIEHSKVCPRYSSVLQRNEDDGVGLEDLDQLQLELETLLVSVCKRKVQLDQEMQILINWQEKKEKKPPGKVPDSSGKRSRSVEGKPTKKFKDSSSKVFTGGTRPKAKNFQQTKLQEYEFNDSPHENRAPKNDAPNRFWATLDPYCTEITPEDIKVLEDLIKCHEDDGEYYKVPALGKHYSYKWAQEDMMEEQKQGSKMSERKKGLSNNSSLNSSESDKLLKKAAAKDYDSGDNSPFGALTQRLVSCLIEENLMTSLDESLTDSNLKDGSPPSSKGHFIKSLNIGNTTQLERRIRRELEEQGILDLDELAVENPDDEIFTELRKCQNELKTLTLHNLSQLKRIVKLAKEEISKQELRKKLQVADNEVMDIYRRVVAARQKKKSPTKKEKDQIMKVLRERENILKQLDVVN